MAYVDVSLLTQELRIIEFLKLQVVKDGLRISTI